MTHFVIQWSIDTNNFKIGLLKIAYEFAVDTISAYFHDDDAIRISEILRDANYEETLQYVNIGNGLQPEIWDHLARFLDLEGRNHYLTLSHSDEMGLVCLIKLHGIFSVGVVLSSRNYLDEGEMHIGINSFADRSFRKINGEMMLKECGGPHSAHPVYYLDPLRKNKEKIEIDSPGFCYVGQENEAIPLYSHLGQFICYLKDALKLARVDSRWIGNKFENTFWLNPNVNYCVKAARTGTLYRIAAYRVEREILRKL